jgi:hypothetical protein
LQNRSLDQDFWDYVAAGEERRAPGISFFIRQHRLHIVPPQAKRLSFHLLRVAHLACARLLAPNQFAIIDTDKHPTRCLGPRQFAGDCAQLILVLAVLRHNPYPYACAHYCLLLATSSED